LRQISRIGQTAPKGVLAADKEGASRRPLNAKG
jgi:hypothetical protein